MMNTVPDIRKLLQHSPVAMKSPVVSLDDAALAARVRMVAGMKRFFECYCADPAFRARVATDATAPAAEGISIDPADVSEFLRRNQPGQAFSELTGNLRLYQDFRMDTQGGLNMIDLASSSNNVPFKAWRERQLARLRFDFSGLGDLVVRPAAAFELSKGCSVGCWFCAISAERLTGIFAYADTGGALWRSVVKGLSEIIGTAAGSSFCYWATDPFDNPDYETFASDLHALTGVFPPTTTALPLKNLARTRTFIELSQSKGCRLNRFSLLTLPMIQRVHRELSPEELLFVELVLQNPEALVFTDFPRVEPAIRVRAGRALVDEAVAARRNVQTAPGTIACIVGFLVNMVERTVQLVSPCIAGEDWPMGYRVHDQGRFSDGATFERELERMIGRNMALAVDFNEIPRFLSGIEYTQLADGFRLATPAYCLEFRSPMSPPQGFPYQDFGALIRAETMPAVNISAELERRGVSSRDVKRAFELLYRYGVLTETAFHGPRATVPLAAGQLIVVPFKN